MENQYRLTHEKLKNLSEEQKELLLGDSYNAWKSFEELPEQEKEEVFSGLDELIKSVSTEETRLQKIESMKEAKIQAITLDSEGNVKSIIMVKNTITKELIIPPGTLTLDGEVISRREK